jgi:hypothetical protein
MAYKKGGVETRPYNEHLKSVNSKNLKNFAATGGFGLTSPCPAPLRSADRRSENLQERTDISKLKAKPKLAELRLH